MKKWFRKQKKVLAVVMAIFLAALLLLGSIAQFFM